MKEKEIKDKKKTAKKKKSWWKWLLGVIAVLLVSGGAFFLKIRRDSRLRQEQMQAQQEKLIQFYQDQGLTEEEIQEKLKEERGSGMPEGMAEHSDLERTIMRTFRQATGTAGQGRPPGGR